MVASKTAREAAILRDDVEKNAAAAKAGNAKASLALVFAAVRTMVMGAGRMTNVEIEQELKAGSYEQRLERWYQSATEGTLPTDQIDQIREIVGNGYEAKRKGGEEAWSYAYPDKPLPPWLRGQAQPQAAPPPPPGFVPDKKAQGPH